MKGVHIRREVAKLSDISPVPSFPPVPLTLEGSAVLHQFFRFDWAKWKSCADGERARIASEASEVLKRLERDANGKVQTALFSQLGH
jgi:chlorite dismutase